MALAAEVERLPMGEETTGTEATGTRVVLSPAGMPGAVGTKVATVA